MLFAADVHPDPDSGAAGTEYQTIDALRRLGCTVDTIWADDLGRKIAHGNLHYLLELPGRYRDVIGERCRAVEFDVLHVNQGHCYLAARAHEKSRRKGVFVLRSHGLDDRATAELRQWRSRLPIPEVGLVRTLARRAVSEMLSRHDRLAYRYATGVLVSGSLDEDYLVQSMRVPPERVARVPQAPAATFTRRSVRAMDESRMQRILHVGGFAYWKGVHALAAAMNRKLQANESLSLTWVCNATDHPRVREMFLPAIQHKVQLLDWMSQEDLVNVYDSHGIFICPSLFEGFGKVFLEAMSRGLCVIGTPTGGMKDIIRHGQNGMMVDFNDANGICSAIDALMTKAGLAEAVSVAAAIDSRRFSWDRVGRETLAFYERLQKLGVRR